MTCTGRVGFVKPSLPLAFRFETGHSGRQHTPGGRELSMQIQLLKSKIHRAQVTGSHVDYEGSLTIASDLMQKVGLYRFERILCSNLANGHRFETYAIPGTAGSGQIILNGATAHLGKAGDRLTIMSYTLADAALAKTWQPQIIVLGEANSIIQERGI
jgi:aspartate 1-decarboxylase